MLRQAVAIGLALAALTVTIERAAGSPASRAETIQAVGGVYAGPALSGASVVWGDLRGVYTARGGRQRAIWHEPAVEIPPDIPVYQGYPRSVSQRIEAPAASNALSPRRAVPLRPKSR